MGQRGKRVMSIDTMRVGKKYCLINHRETTTFRILAAEGSNDFSVKDQLTLEVYRFTSLISYGRGDDFELFEV